jgi:hypothetical protein
MFLSVGASNDINFSYYCIYFYLDNRVFLSVLRIRDVYPRSRIQGRKDTGSGSASKNFFQCRIPDPGSGSRGQKSTGSRIRIRNTDLYASEIGK